MNPKEQFLADLEKIKARFIKVIQDLDPGKLNRVELARLISEYDFFSELRATGLDDSLEQFFDDYDEQLQLLIDIAYKERVRNAFTINNQALEQLKNLDAEILLGRAKDYASIMKRGLLLGAIEGKPFDDVVKELSEIPLTNAQINAAITTGFNDYGRALTAVTFPDKEQQFIYVGTIIETSAKSCTWLLMNQPETGYLKSEIDKGIKTPFGMINWNGRIPNFNCDDEWLPATKEIIKRAKTFKSEYANLAAMVLQGKGKK
jgi:hypothetical protein